MMCLAPGPSRTVWFCCRRERYWPKGALPTCKRTGTRMLPNFWDMARGGDMSKAFRLGVFIVAMLLIFAAGVYWIGSKQFLFTSTYRLNAEFTNVAGLNGG